DPSGHRMDDRHARGACSVDRYRDSDDRRSLVTTRKSPPRPCCPRSLRGQRQECRHRVVDDPTWQTGRRWTLTDTADLGVRPVTADDLAAIGRALGNEYLYRNRLERQAAGRGILL